jgi:hypothetical protein
MMQPNDVMALLTVSTGVVVILLGPVGRAIGRRIEGRRAEDDGALRAAIEEAEHRLAEVDEFRARLAEVEERLDFQERLLTRGPADARPPAGEDVR